MGLTKVEIDQGIAILSLNRPEKHNSFSIEILNELMQTLDSLSADKSVRVLILTGEGEKSFSSGADLTVLQNFKAIEDARDYALLLESASQKLFNFPKPVISALNGFAIGGGLGFAAATDYRIASENSKMGFPAVRLGAILPVSCTLFMTHIIGLSHTREMLFTGKMLTAQEALNINLVNTVVPHKQVIDESIKVAKLMLEGSDMALFYTKKTINSLLARELESKSLYAADNFAFLSQTKEWKERITNFGKKK